MRNLGHRSVPAGRDRSLRPADGHPRRAVPYAGTVPKAPLDVSGRKVLDLKVGANDVSRLPPGVYSVTENGARCTVHARKAIVTR
jgi:hypothetical protein